MPVFIRERGNSQSVIDVFDRLDALLGTERVNTHMS
jgi:hypothetical protein